MQKILAVRSSNGTRASGCRRKIRLVAESDDYADQRLLERLVAVLEGDSRSHLPIAIMRCYGRRPGDERIRGLLLGGAGRSAVES